LDVQVFDRDQAVAVDQPTRELMVRVRPLVADVGLRGLAQSRRFAAPPGAPAATASHPALRSSHLRCRPSGVARVRDGGPVAPRGEVGQPDVDADRLGGRGKRRGLDVHTDPANHFPASRVNVSVLIVPSMGR
jgi:hypothetical protein